MTAWLDDFRRGYRALRRTPLSSAGLGLVLALGIGANAAIFTLVHAVLLRPLPYERADELVMVWNARNSARDWRLGATGEQVMEWKQAAHGLLADIAVLKLSPGSREASVDLVLQSGAERLRAGIVTPNFFEVLGVYATIGRVFSSNDEATGRMDVAVLSDALWRRGFGADPAIVGRQIILSTGDGPNRQPRPYIVQGVLRPQFKFTYPLETEVWLMNSWAAVQASPRYAITFEGAVARLSPGVTQAQAAGAIADAARREQPDLPAARRQITRLEPITDWVNGDARASILLLTGTALTLLLIACATVASALLVRLTERQRDYAIRAALGARRAQLAREAAAEALVLALGGTLVGVAIALAVVPAFRALVPSIVPRGNEIGVNLWLVVFAGAIVAIVTLLSAVAPAFQAGRIDVAAALKRSSISSTTDCRGGRLRTAVLSGQIAVATCLLIASSLLVLSFWRLGRVDLGFDGGGVLTVEMRLLESRYSSPDVKRRLQHDLLARVRAIPGVLEAGITSAVPFRGVDWTMSLSSIGGGPRVTTMTRIVDAAFFSIMKVPLRLGRLFTTADTATSSRVAVVSASFAQAMFGREDVVGRTFDVDGPVEVVGVVSDLRYAGFDRDAARAVYLSREQQPSELMCLVVRSVPHLTNLGTSLRAAVREVDPTLPAMRITTIDRILDESVADRRFYTTTTAGFAILALLLTAAALIVVVARAAAERRRELAVRAALGASAGELVRLVARQAALPILGGIAGGVTAAWFATAIVAQFLFRVTPREPAAYVAAALTVLAVAGISSIVPARRAAILPVAGVLRGE